jgi:hypothetical protein
VTGTSRLKPYRPSGGARNVEGRTYLERGRPVVVLTAWGPGGGPRNVRIRREDGTVTIRPFRGLRRAERSRPCPS